MLIFTFTDRESKAQRRLSEQGQRDWDENLNPDQLDTTDPFFMLHHVASFVLFLMHRLYISIYQLKSTPSVEPAHFDNTDTEIS